MVWFEGGFTLQGEQLDQGNPAICGSHHLKKNTINIQSLQSDFIRPVQVRHCASLRGNARNQRIVYMCFPRGKQDHSQSELNLLLKRQSQSQPVASICFFFTCLDLMRIPEWNAGKRWYSGPSTSGRGGHGSGRGQVLRVVRNGQGREISPYWCTISRKEPLSC